MIFTKSPLQTYKDEYNDIIRALFNVKVKMQAECEKKFKEINKNQRGYITSTEFNEHFCSEKCFAYDDDPFLSIDDVFQLMLSSNISDDVRIYHR